MANRFLITDMDIWKIKQQNDWIEFQQELQRQNDLEKKGPTEIVHNFLEENRLLDFAVKLVKEKSANWYKGKLNFLMTNTTAKALIEAENPDFKKWKKFSNNVLVNGDQKTAENWRNTN